jgi:hypothetical protein
MGLPPEEDRTDLNVIVALILKLIPTRYAGVAKTIIVAIGTVAGYAQAVWADNPRVAAVIGVLTMLGVYKVPNEMPTEPIVETVPDGSDAEYDA